MIDHLNVAPSVSLVLGSVAGFGAARATTAHYSVIVRGTAQMMIAGPALVEQAALGSVSKEELGHADIHSTNGAVDDAVDTEAEAFDRALDFLSYLPSSVDELPPVEPCEDPVDRREQRLADIVPRSPRQSYDMRAIVTAVVDAGSFFEIGRAWGTSIIGGFARLAGIPVAIYAENPMMLGGGWTADSCRKLIRLIDVASLFKLPIVHLEDCPGFLIGIEAERTCTVRFGSEVLVALRQAQVPYCTVVIRKAFGIAGASNRKPGTESMRMAWPSGDWGSLPIEGGLEVAYKAELAASDDPAGLHDEIAERLNRLRSPHRSAEFYEIEQIIDPRDTRPMLCDWVRLGAPHAGPRAAGVGLPAVTLPASDREWLTGLPKVELHCHLEGSMSVDTVRALTERHGADPTPIWPDGFPDVFSFDGFPSFARQFWFGLSLLRTGDDLATVTADLARTLARQNVRYAELTTTAFTHFRGHDGRPGMSWSEYREGLDEGRRQAAAFGVEIGWIVDIPRDLELPEQTVTIDFLESACTPEGLVAIGLGGYEVGFPGGALRAALRAGACDRPPLGSARRRDGRRRQRAPGGRGCCMPSASVTVSVPSRIRRWSS